MSGSLSIEPLTPALGAEIHGVDLRNPEPGSIDALQRAFATYSVLFVRDQRLDPDALLEVTRRFGPVFKVPYVAGLDTHPEIIAVLKEPEERAIATFGGTWHSDFSFLHAPPAATLLYALELPPIGGDTLWANQYLAYATLSPAMQRLLRDLRAVHTGAPHGTRGPGPGAAVSRSIKMVRNDPRADREVLHPVVRVHPVTGRPALFVNPVYTQRLEGMREEESRPLLDFLFRHAVREKFTCRLRWRPGTLAIWDNRCVMHRALNDYDGHRRLLHRSTTAGEVPAGATP